ncbi:MAG: nitroreductase family protein [Anaerolineae bacterium]|nr:nitroreductase family protein [Anaerolineae bacterium]
MDAIEAIMTRRSIRRYSGTPVQEALVTQLLETAMAAPSANNQQPWHFIVIDDRALLDAITKVHPYSQMLKEAPLAIMICGDTQLARHSQYWVQDCAAATQNVLVAARALGLGSVWMGCYPNEERAGGLQRLFKLPDSVIPLALIAIGYPAEEKGAANRYNPDRVHRNQW